MNFFNRFRRSPLLKSASDTIFALSSAYITLETKLGLKSTGRSAISLKAVDGMYFLTMKEDIRNFLNVSRTDFDLTYRILTDTYGYLWIIIEGKNMEDILAGMTAVGDIIYERGFADNLLATVFQFISGTLEANPSSQYLIYNYKRNNFYPFVPLGQKNRDTEQEMKILSAVDQELRFEKDMSNWYPLWDVPL